MSAKITGVQGVFVWPNCRLGNIYMSNAGELGALILIFFVQVGALKIIKREGTSILMNTISLKGKRIFLKTISSKGERISMKTLTSREVKHFDEDQIRKLNIMRAGMQSEIFYTRIFARYT